MEEIKFKPSVRVEGFLLFLALLVLSIGLFILINVFNLKLDSVLTFVAVFAYLLFFLITNFVKKFFIKYSISENEIELFYEFISKESNVFRMDQITSVELSRNFIEKIFGLGTISFGVFGSANLFDNKSPIAGHSFRSISNYDEIFNFLSNNLSLENYNIIYQEKPSTTPSLVYFFGFLILSIFTSLFLISFNFFENPYLIGAFPFLFLYLFVFFYKFLLMKSSKFSIGDISIVKEYDFIFATKKVIVPIQKITNSNINKNLISYGLFKVGTVKLFTGGDKDPFFDSLVNFEKFYSNLGNLLRSKKVNLENNQTLGNVNQVKVDETTSLNQHLENEDCFKTKPGNSFILTFVFWWSVILGVLFSIIIMFRDLIIFDFKIQILLIIFITIYLIGIIFRFILWKNTRYEFYSDRLVDISGIINIKRKEIYFKNIKHISLTKKLFFDRILNQGTIHIYTPGTIYLDNKINSIKEYEEIYKQLKIEIE